MKRTVKELESERERLLEENKVFLKTMVELTEENKKLKSDNMDLKKYKVKYDKLIKTRVVRG